MPEVLIIADDLTGANDTGVMITQQGLRTCTVLNAENPGDDALSNHQCLSYSTNSRGIDSRAAYHKVFEAVRCFGTPDTILYSKRIDSTLRGNLGAETDAMLDALSDQHTAIIVPAFPHAGRIYVGGHLLVYDTPLFRTAVATDPKTPVNTASALKLYQEQSAYPAAAIHLEELKDGIPLVVDKIHALRDQGVRGIIFDAAQEEDLGLIADAVLASKIPFIAVDPGSFTAQVVTRIPGSTSKNKQKKKILFAVGSVNQVAARQAQLLLQQKNVGHVLLDAERILLSEAERNQEIKRVTTEILTLGDTFDVCCICTSGIFPENCLDLDLYAKQQSVTNDDISSLINDSLAQIIQNILSATSDYKGLFCCGGDIAIAVCTALNAYGIMPLADVVPLAVYGRIAGGSNDGLHLITKGGMIGDDHLMINCISYFHNKFKE